MQRELEALGVTVYCPRRVDAVRLGKKRYADAVVSPFLPNYLFLDMTADLFTTAIGVKHVAPTLHVIPHSEIARVLDFVDSIERDFDKREARIKAGEQVEQYTEGQLLDVFTGPFKDSVATFQRIVYNGDDFPTLRAGIEMMGREVTVDLDVLHVKAAE